MSQWLLTFFSLFSIIFYTKSPSPHNKELHLIKDMLLSTIVISAMRKIVLVKYNWNLWSSNFVARNIKPLNFQNCDVKSLYIFFSFMFHWVFCFEYYWHLKLHLYLKLWYPHVLFNNWQLFEWKMFGIKELDLKCELNFRLSSSIKKFFMKVLSFLID